MALETDTPDRVYTGKTAAAVTPSDTSNISIGFSRALFIGGAGNLTVTMLDGNDAVFTGILAGTLLPVGVTRVKSTGTTATNITAIR